MSYRGYDQKLILKVNEVYHDITAETYSQTHPEVFTGEERWRRITRKYLIKDSPVTILDVGTGTGFVPLVIAPFLKKEDTVICTDISPEMLRVCKNEISRRQFECQFKFVKLSEDLNSIIREQIDFITLNSVLHHIPNVDGFCRQIDAILHPGGSLIMAHEPNKLFFNNWFLWMNYSLLMRLMNARTKASNQKSNQSGNIIIEKVNNRLIEEGFIEKPLTAIELISIVDIHEPPDIGESHKEQGFDIHQLIKESLPDFYLIHFETYNHCYKLTSKNRLIKHYSNFMRRILPDKGATFLAVLNKKP